MTAILPKGALQIVDAYAQFRDWYWSQLPILNDERQPNWIERERRDKDAQDAFLAPFFDGRLSMEAFYPESEQSGVIPSPKLTRLIWPEHILLSETLRFAPNEPLAQLNGQSPWVDAAAFEAWFDQYKQQMALKPRRISLGEAIWLIAYPAGPSEVDWINETYRLRHEIEDLLLKAKREWRTVGFDETDFEPFEKWKIEEGYKRVQVHLSDIAYSEARPKRFSKARTLMQAAHAYLAGSDERFQRIEAAKKAFQEAAREGHFPVMGRKDGIVMNELPEIDPSYFRHSREIIWELGNDNRIFADQTDSHQRGHDDYLEVEVVFTAFERWMIATGRWQFTNAGETPMAHKPMNTKTPTTGAASQAALMAINNLWPNGLDGIHAQRRNGLVRQWCRENGKAIPADRTITRAVGLLPKA